MVAVQGYTNVYFHLNQRMNFDSVMKMRELELESEEPLNTGSESDEDCDICENDEIDRLFTKCHLISEKRVASNKKYILQIAATLDSSPNVALNLSNSTCEVYNLSNNQFAKLTVLSEHTDVISEVKFCKENNNLVYTGSNDGSVRLWDIRTPNKSIVQFKDTTIGDDTEVKQLNCFDVSPNNRLLAAGTNLFEGDAFILFWDLRKHALLGGYWECHTDDITQVKFHSNDSNKLISGSVDGLINVYDLSQTSEDDALTDTLNTESSVEKIGWLQQEGKDIISCITHTADVQFWKLDNAQPYLHLHRFEIATQINRPAEDVHIVDVHAGWNSIFILTGSNYQEGECFRGVSLNNNSTKSVMVFPQNKQRVRASWLNFNTNLLLTGGEKGIVSAWDMKCVKSSELPSPSKKK